MCNVSSVVSRACNSGTESKRPSRATPFISDTYRRVMSTGVLPSNWSNASLTRASAARFCSRGTQVYETWPAGITARATLARSRMSGCLICQRPDICSTTNLESSLTSTRASASISTAACNPAIAPPYSATLFVAVPTDSAISTSTLPVMESRTSEPKAAGPGLPRLPPSASTIRSRVMN